jgi:hypothetical protein
MKRKWVVVGALLVALLADTANNRLKLREAEETLVRASNTMELLSRVNRTAFETLDSCRETNLSLLTSGQQHVMALFSRRATELKANREKGRTRIARLSLEPGGVHGREEEP